MPEPTPRGLRALLALPNEDPRKIVSVALALCLVCSVLVATAAVTLKPLQERNAQLARKAEILRVAGLLTEGVDVEQAFGRIQTRLVDLETGEYVAGMDPARFDERAAARDPDTSTALPADVDVASIKRRANYSQVYLVPDAEGRITTVVLPVYGAGLWSTIYGYLALGADGRTVQGLTFYEHGETAGLGDQITNPRWLAQFPGKEAVDAQGRPLVRVQKGAVAPGSPEARYAVDAIAGATLTSNGVTNLLQFWLGEAGFGSYLARLRKGEV